MHATQKEDQDWEITEDGLSIATRGYLIRRGYCCANRCRNCPYINWRMSIEWQPIPAECVRRTSVSVKAIAGAHSMLCYHEQQVCNSPCEEREQHYKMIEHYRILLERWGANR